MPRSSDKGTRQASTPNVTVSSFPERLLNSGSSAQAPASASTVASNVTSTDSERNKAISRLRDDPSTLRTPSSRLRLAERAVDRLIKLIQAINNTKKATADKKEIYPPLPLASISRRRCECRWISVSGVKVVRI